MEGLRLCEILVGSGDLRLRQSAVLLDLLGLRCRICGGDLVGNLALLLLKCKCFLLATSLISLELHLEHMPTSCHQAI
jgi:hypothetical protein